jgi:hypothetical protein
MKRSATEAERQNELRQKVQSIRDDNARILWRRAGLAKSDGRAFHYEISPSTRLTEGSYVILEVPRRGPVYFGQITDQKTKTEEGPQYGLTRIIRQPPQRGLLWRL